MTQASEGDTVRVHYTGKLESGEVFDSSKGREPLEFTLGGGQVIPGFEEAVAGMAPGDTKTATIPVDEAYGPRREDAVLQIAKDQLPDDLDPEVGQNLQIQQPNGQAVPVTVKEIADEAITVDANHPLAGKDLVFDLELVEIV